jgi:hypothetical protein
MLKCLGKTFMHKALKTLVEIKLVSTELTCIMGSNEVPCLSKKNKKHEKNCIGFHDACYTIGGVCIVQAKAQR